MSLPVFDQQTSPFTAQATNTKAVSVSTAGTNRVLFLVMEAGSTGTPLVSGVSGASLTWQKRWGYEDTTYEWGVTELWWALAPTQLTSAAITISFTGGNFTNFAGTIFSYSGCSAAVFDSNASLPAKTTSVGNTAISRTINTTQANDIIFGIIGGNESAFGADATAGSGFTQFVAAASTTGLHAYATIWAQRKSVTAAQSGLVVTATPTLSGGKPFVYVVDAITGDNPPSGAATMSDLWFSAVPSFVDLTVGSNRRNFISVSGGAQNLGSDGSAPFGVTPPVFLIRDGVPATFAVNAGRGGAFIVSGGTLTTGSTSPPASSTTTTTSEPWGPGQGVLGDYLTGNLYAFNKATFTDNGTRRRWLRRWRALPGSTAVAVKFAWLSIDLQTGIGVPDGTDPQLVLRWSDDGGFTYSDERIVAVGASGETTFQVKFNRLGMTRRFSGSDRIFELSSSDPFSVAIFDAEVEAH